MRSFFLIPALAYLARAAVPISSVPRTTTLNVVPNKFIIEVDTTAHIPTRRSLDHHEALYEMLRARAPGFEVDREFKADGLFVGASVTLQSPADAAKVANAPGVKAIRPVVKVAAPKPVFKHIVTGPKDSALPADTESTHVITGVDKLHAEGVLGGGVKVGIIDTGTDYNHPSLGAGFGPGHKVAGGTDLVGDAYDGTNTPVPDADPLDECNGHGTHVAGIVAADTNNDFGISGVAPASSIFSYRVFGCAGFTTDDIIIQALLQGVSDGVDILTLSLGGADGWTESSSSVVASRIAATGKIVTIAAGNDGASGSWYTSSPGNGINVISAASLDNTVVPIQNATISGVAHNPIPYFSLFPLPIDGAKPIFAISTDTTVVDDACNPLPDSTPDLSPFVVLIRRGSCTFVQKLTNAAAKGAKQVLIYDNGNGFAAIATGQFIAALIQADDGVFLVNQFAAGVPVTISFPQTGASFNFPNPTGGLISSFTSYGPTNDFFFKPAVAAPGGGILSTFPIKLGSFAILSGTSMATPFMAGSSALLFQSKGKSRQVGTTARTLFQTTANTVPASHDDGSPLHTVTQQGAGLVNVFKAIHTTTIVSPGELILNDTANFRPVQRFTITNTGRTAQTFKLSHAPAGTALTVQPGTIFAALGPVPLSTAAAGVIFTANSVTVRPGRTETVTVVFTPPRGLDASTFPVFSGFIKLTSKTESLQVSYVGLAQSLKNKQVVDNTDVIFGVKIPLVIDSVGNVQEAPTDYTLAGGDFPTLLWRQVFGTPTVRVDLVDANIKVQTNLKREPEDGSHVYSRSLFSFPHHGQGTFAQVKTVGALFEVDFLTRNNEDDNLQNTFALSSFANGTAIPKGSFRLLLRSLRVTGDPTKESDFEVFLSPIIGVV